MRVNVYAEEMTDRIEIISKQIEGQTFTGLRFYLELPVTIPGARVVQSNHHAHRADQLRETAFGEHTQIAGPFMHHRDDDDSAAVTFWGKQDLRTVLRKALSMLDEHYASRKPGGPDFERAEVLANSILTSHGNEFYGTNEGRRALAQAFLALLARRHDFESLVRECLAVFPYGTYPLPEQCLLSQIWEQAKSRDELRTHTRETFYAFIRQVQMTSTDTNHPICSRNADDPQIWVWRKE